jgi:hypothetical protein
MQNIQSQKVAIAGKAAWVLTFFILIWNSLVFGLMLPIRDIPFWFKAIFVVAGFAITVVTVFSWRARILGGKVVLRLSNDPVPHGLNVYAKFKLAKPIQAKLWAVEAMVQTLEGETNTTVWRQIFPVQAMSTRRLTARFAFPSDYSPKYSYNSPNCKRTLTLKADELSWEFTLKARNAASSEMLFEWQNAASLGNNLKIYTSADIEKNRRYVSWMTVASIVIFIAIALTQFTSFFDVDLIGRAKAQVGLGAYSSQVSTEEFDVRVTNSLQYHRSLRVRLLGKGRVVNGEFRVRVEGLDIQPNSACREKAKSCEVASVTLLLSQDGDNNFSTQAKSAPIDVNLQLQDITNWSLPAERIGTELVMKLPPSVDVDTMRLKLEIRAADGSTVYPEGGPYLALHRALAKAAGKTDPCEKIGSKLRLVKAGCDQQLQASLGKPLGLISSISAQGQRAWFATRQFAAKLGLGSAPKADEETLDNLLLEALMNENFTSANALIAMGANPNTEDTYQIGRTVLGYAAASWRKGGY